MPTVADSINNAATESTSRVHGSTVDGHPVEVARRIEQSARRLFSTTGLLAERVQNALFGRSIYREDNSAAGRRDGAVGSIATELRNAMKRAARTSEQMPAWGNALRTAGECVKCRELAGCVQLEKCSSVSWLVASARGAINVACLVDGQILGKCAVCLPGKPVQHRLLAGLSDLEDHSAAQAPITTGDAAKAGGAIEIAVGHDQAKLGLPLVLSAILAAFEAVQHLQRSILGQFEYRPAAAGTITAKRGNSIEVAWGIAKQAANGDSAVGCAGESVEDRLLSLGIQLEHNSPVRLPSELGCAVEVAGRLPD